MPDQKPPKTPISAPIEDKILSPKDDLTPLNIKKKSKNQISVALSAGDDGQKTPKIIAAGRGKLAEQILQLAFEKGIKVREDEALAEMLATIELDSPIPSEAFMAVAEILSYVYRANGEHDPFNALLDPVTFQSISDSPKG
jgi:flagellar biosynthesis protein